MKIEYSISVNELHQAVHEWLHHYKGVPTSSKSHFHINFNRDKENIATYEFDEGEQNNLEVPDK